MAPLEIQLNAGASRGSARIARSLMWCALGLVLVAGGASASELGHAPNFRAPTITTSTLTGVSVEKARCDEPECVRRHLDAQATVRITGEFGSFTGKVARWGADSLAGFTAHPDSSTPTPAGALTWSQVQRVDERVGHAGRDAVFGALLGGALGLVIPWAIYAAGDQHSEIVPGLGGVVAGAFAGAFVGGVIGASSFHWRPVYQRP